MAIEQREIYNVVKENVLSYLNEEFDEDRSNKIISSVEISNDIILKLANYSREDSMTQEKWNDLVKKFNSVYNLFQSGSSKHLNLNNILLMPKRIKVDYSEIEINNFLNEILTELHDIEKILAE